VDSEYTTTITDEAKRRGIEVKVIDRQTPVFVLKHKDKKVRCYNALTDYIGAVSFILAQDKHLANRFLKKNGFSVPDQQLYSTPKKAAAFLSKHKKIVVKPAKQEGGCGIAVGIDNEKDLNQAMLEAGQYSEDRRIILEEYFTGTDKRLVLIDYKFIAALQRTPAFVTGNGKDTIKTLIRKRNTRTKITAPHNLIPLDNETKRNLASSDLDYSFVPGKRRKIQVRQTSNYHTGGTMKNITGSIEEPIVKTAEQIALLFELPVVGIDFLVDENTGKYRIIEVSPDLAISPRSGKKVARAFIDYLFPDSKSAVKL